MHSFLLEKTVFRPSGPNRSRNRPDGTNVNLGSSIGFDIDLAKSDGQRDLAALRECLSINGP
jgi:hypothetical protein